MIASRLPLLLLPAISLALAACERPRDEGCPGQVIASLALHGELDQAGCAVPPAGGWEVPDRLPDGPPLAPGDPTPTFAALFAWDEAAQRLSYCPGVSHAAVLHGTRSGDHLRVETTLPGAVLDGCRATCTPLMTVLVEGDLSGGNGTPLTFSGALTETFDRSPGSCEPCQLPCASRYLLTGTER